MSYLSACDMPAISDELLFGKRHGSTVLVLVVNLHKWRSALYLYFCVLGLDRHGGGRELALASIEMLSYRLVSNTGRDSTLVDAFEAFGGDGAASFRTALVLHGVKAGSYGFVPDATFGSGGRWGLLRYRGNPWFSSLHRLGSPHHAMEYMNL